MKILKGNQNILLGKKYVYSTLTDCNLRMKKMKQNETRAICL